MTASKEASVNKVSEASMGPSTVPAMTSGMDSVSTDHAPSCTSRVVSPEWIPVTLAMRRCELP